MKALYMTATRVSIASKLRLGFGLALLILLVIGGVSFFGTMRLVAVTAARAQSRQFLRGLEQVVSNLLAAQNAQRGYLLTGAPEHLDALRQSSEAIEASMIDLSRRNPALRKRVEGLRPLIDRELKILQSGINIRDREGLMAAAAEIQSGRGSSEMEAIRNAVREIETRESAVLADRAREATATASRTFRTIGLGTLLALVAVTLASFLIARGITVPVRELVAGTERIGRGELSTRIQIRSNDEIAELGSAFNHMAESLESQGTALAESGSALTGGVRVMTSGSDMLLARSKEQLQLAEVSSGSIGNLRRGIETTFRTSETVTDLTQDSSVRAAELQASSRHVHDNMDRLFESVAKTSSSTLQMSAASTQMSQMTAALFSAGEEVLSFVAEMEATAAELERSAQATADLSRRATEAATGGRISVDETVASIEQSETLTERASTMLTDLATHVSDIGRILAVITQVTDRTNLLALNAAIIAAQAGEHGRGFTVVADEMRQLADETRRSTNEISTIISGVQNGSRDAVAAMRESVDRVRGTVSLARQASGALSGIVTTSTSSFEMAQRMSDSLGQQTQASRRLHETSSRMAESIGQSRRSIEEQASGAMLLAQEAERVHDIAAQVKNASEEQSLGATGIGKTIEQIDNEARAMRDLLRQQLAETEQIAAAADAMREIARQNDTLSQEFTDTVRRLAQSGERFQDEMMRRRASEEPPAQASRRGASVPER